jgi:hypothetical protein
MPYSAPQGDVHIGSINSAALRKEIGERLRASLNQNLVETPPHLLLLMKHLRDEPTQIRVDLKA